MSIVIFDKACQNDTFKVTKYKNTAAIDDIIKENACLVIKNMCFPLKLLNNVKTKDG